MSWWLSSIVLAGTLFLLLAVMATMRETVVLRGEIGALKQLIKHPPAPSFARSRGRLPAALIDAITATEERRPTDQAVQLIAFVSPGCQPCENLTSSLKSAVERGDVAADELIFIVWATEEVRAAKYRDGLPGRALLDLDADLQRAAEIRGTPTLLVVSRPDFRVVDYSLEGDAEWVITQFSSGRHTLTPA